MNNFSNFKFFFTLVTNGIEYYKIINNNVCHIINQTDISSFFSKIIHLKGPLECHSVAAKISNKYLFFS